MQKLRLIPLLFTAGVIFCGCRADESSAAPAVTAERTEPSSVTETTTESETTTTETTTTAPRIRNLVTLGDSISAGYGLDRPETQRYSALLTQKLAEADQLSWNDFNYAVSGDDSSDLLKLLQEQKAEHLKEADLICLYIGANNLLGPYTDYLKSFTAIFQKPDSDSGAIGWIGKIAGALENNVKSFQSIQEKVDAGMSRLSSDLPATYNLIREQNADAPIYLLTVYHPYAKVSVENPVTKENFGAYSGEKINRLNEIIKSFAASHPDIRIVDIYSEFEKCETVPVLGNINEGVSKDKKVNVDPHPNPDGQKLIAETVFAAVRGAG